MLYGKLLEVLSAKLTEESEWLGTVIHNKIGINWTLSFYNTHTHICLLLLQLLLPLPLNLGDIFSSPAGDKRSSSEWKRANVGIITVLYSTYDSYSEANCAVLCLPKHGKNGFKNVGKKVLAHHERPGELFTSVSRRNLSIWLRIKKKKKKKKTEINLGRTVCPSQLS